MHRPLFLLPAWFGLFLASATGAASAQQFQNQPGAFPNPVHWTEGVELADVDRDGDLDIIFAEGDGFSFPGAKRQNVLLINQFVPSGSLTFTDESVARFGSNSSNAKGVTTGDVNGDGWVDVLFANGFNTDPPFLYINQGPAQPGVFALESATRGFTSNYSSASAQFGDLDDDGDLDVIICDSGSSFLGGAGGKPHLFFNDGAGNFSEDAASLGAPTKTAHMDVQLADVDGDFDLDFFGPNRGSSAGGNHYLMLNDGEGEFTDVSSTVPAFSTSTYEAEVGDLDGDTDLDLFFVSLSGFSEGYIENEIVPNGSLSWSAGTPFGGTDDNEIGLVDHDNDGDLDVIVGSLGSREVLYRNDGGLVFADTGSANGIQAVFDSTLDIALGDLDNDGDYDLVTAQGESGNFTNKLFLNTGSPDTLAPRILAEHSPAAPLAWPVILHGRVQDQVVDDGVNYVTAFAKVTPLLASVETVTFQGGVFSPAVLNVPAGTRVTYVNNDATPQTVTSLSPPYDYDLALAPSGGSADYLFVSPGTYDYETSGGASAQIVVSGGYSEIPATYSGGGQFRFSVGQLPATATDAFVSELWFTDYQGNTRVSISREVPYPGPGAVNFCTGLPNSIGDGAMSWSGSLSVAANQFTLVANSVPNSFGIFFYSMGQSNGGDGVLFGNGLRCVGNASSPVYRLPITQGANNVQSHPLDFTSPLQPGGVITGGSTWNFQCWFRDTAGGFAGFNLSDGLQVFFGN